MTDFLRKDRSMNLLRFGVIAGAHIVVFGIIYMMSGVGSGEQGDEQVSLAGANGIVNWSNKDANAGLPTVNSSGFDSRASDINGFNAGDTILVAQTQTPSISSRQRFEPTRPGGSQQQQQPNRDDGVLQPLGGNSSGGFNQPSDIIARNPVSDMIRYTVRSGDSLWGISKKFKITSDDLHSVNPGLTVNIQPGQVLNIPRPSGAADLGPAAIAVPAKVDGTIYTVRGGDVLSKIAARQGVTLNELKAANNLSGDLIKVGQKLVIPTARRTTTPLARRGQGLQVVVAPGDSLFSIGERYNVTAKDLMLHNNLQDPQRINPGQTLFIPSSVATRAAATPKPTVAPPVERTPQPMRQVVPEDQPLQLIDEDDILQDEDLIEQPVIPIEE